LKYVMVASLLLVVIFANSWLTDSIYLGSILLLIDARDVG